MQLAKLLMGVKLLGKVKIHEIAKELDLTSKEIIERATKLGIEVKNHMSSVEDDIATKIKESFKAKKSNEVKEEQSQAKKEKTAKQDTPVIIRREVIVSDEELAKKEEEERKRQMEAKKKEVGFVERNNNKDFNIVYRNKPSKPMSVSELFGLKTPQKEETKQENKKEDVGASIARSQEKEDSPKQEVKKLQPIPYSSSNSGYRNNNQNNNHQNRNGHFGDNRNNGFNQNRNNNGFKNNNSQNGYNGRERNNQNGGFQNRNSNGFRNNQNNGYGGRRPLDEKGIEKNIKNIMTEMSEKEVVREYNKSIDKQKQNRYEENKMKKSPKSRRGGDYDFNEDKLKSLKQQDRLSNMFDDSDGGMLDYYDLTTRKRKEE